ncbi:MAG: acylneuraminate cytidylyltransferase family protein [Bacteroidota bacterium]
MKIVSIIPARGGSKTLPRKNVKLLESKPLIAHTIGNSLEAKLVDQTYVSTDDSEISSVAVQYGAKIINRPPKLAIDTASSESALVHALRVIEEQEEQPDLIVFLQCTSPIRTGQDVDNAIRKLQAEGADSLVSVSPSHRFLWEEVEGVAKSINYDYRNRPRRQDMNSQYVENGSIYVCKPWVLNELGNRLGGKISLFVMPEEQSWEIDTLADFEFIEHLLSKSKH